MSKLDTIIKCLDMGISKEHITKLVDAGFSDAEIENYIHFEKSDTSVIEPANEPVNEPANEPVNEPANEPVNEPTNSQYVMINQDNFKQLMQELNVRNVNNSVDLPPSAEEISIKRLAELMK